MHDHLAVAVDIGAVGREIIFKIRHLLRHQWVFGRENDAVVRALARDDLRNHKNKRNQADGRHDHSCLMMIPEILQP